MIVSFSSHNLLLAILFLLLSNFYKRALTYACCFLIFQCSGYTLTPVESFTCLLLRYTTKYILVGLFALGCLKLKLHCIWLMKICLPITLFLKLVLKFCS